MKKYIIFLLLAASNIAILDADESLKIAVHASCSDSRDLFKGNVFSTDSRREEFSISIGSNRLNLSKDALQDNTGGYVDIAEDRYYLKSNEDVYRLKGSVERSKKKNINTFTSSIYKHSKKALNTQELYNLKNSTNLKFIQKINLVYKNNKTNILNVYFDKDSFDREYQKCEEQIHKSKNKFYTQSLFVLLFVFGLLYLLRRKK